MHKANRQTIILAVLAMVFAFTMEAVADKAKKTFASANSGTRIRRSQRRLGGILRLARTIGVKSWWAKCG